MKKNNSKSKPYLVEFVPCEPEPNTFNSFGMLFINGKNTGSKFIEFENRYDALDTKSYRIIKKVNLYDLPDHIDVVISIKKPFQYFTLDHFYIRGDSNQRKIQFCCMFDEDKSVEYNLNYLKIAFGIEDKLEKLKCRQGSFEAIYDEDWSEMYELMFEFTTSLNMTIEEVVMLVCGILKELENKMINKMLMGIKNGKK